MEFIDEHLIAFMIFMISITTIFVGLKIRGFLKELYNYQRDLEDFVDQAACDQRDVKDKLEEIQRDLAYLSGKMTPPVFFNPREIQEKPPYTGAKRGPKPKPFLTTEE